MKKNGVITEVYGVMSLIFQILYFSVPSMFLFRQFSHRFRVALLYWLILVCLSLACVWFVNCDFGSFFFFSLSLQFDQSYTIFENASLGDIVLCCPGRACRHLTAARRPGERPSLPVFFHHKSQFSRRALLSSWDEDDRARPYSCLSSQYLICTFYLVSVPHQNQRYHRWSPRPSRAVCCQVLRRVCRWALQGTGLGFPDTGLSSHRPCRCVWDWVRISGQYNTTRGDASHFQAKSVKNPLYFPHCTCPLLWGWRRRPCVGTMNILSFPPRGRVAMIFESSFREWPS